MTDAKFRPPTDRLRPASEFSASVIGRNFHRTLEPTPAPNFFFGGFLKPFRESSQTDSCFGGSKIASLSFGSSNNSSSSSA